MQSEEYALRLNAGDFASRSKSKAKPQKLYFASSSTRTFPFGYRTWTDVEPGKQSLSDYPVSKILIHLLRDGQHVHREDDGAVQFLRIKENIQKHFLYCPHCSDESGRAAWQEEEETRKDTSTVLILQKQLCISELFKDIQDAILLILLYRTMSLFRAWFLQVHLSRRMCNQFTFHHHFRIDTGRTKFEQQTDSILAACGSYGQKIIRILTRSTWKHRVLHNTCTKDGTNIKIRFIGSTSTLR